MIGEMLLAGERRQVRDEDLTASVTLCTGCGACQEHCHLHEPLPDAIRAAWGRLLPAVTPTVATSGEGRYAVIETDARAWGPALAAHLGESVVSVRLDGSGVVWSDLARQALLDAIGDRIPVVADGGTAEVLEGVDGVVWLHQLVPETAVGRGSCRVDGVKPTACCGGAGPLAEHHPDTAARVARAWGDGAVDDARCCGWLQRSGLRSEDAVDRLLAMVCR
jgi:ferredoxin